MLSFSNNRLLNHLDARHFEVTKTTVKRRLYIIDNRNRFPEGVRLTPARRRNRTP